MFFFTANCLGFAASNCTAKSQQFQVKTHADFQMFKSGNDLLWSPSG